MLVCDEHKHLPQNKELLQTYKEKYITKRQNLPSYSKELNIIQPAQQTTPKQDSYVSSSCDDSAIYLLQHINVNNRNYLIFYDNGCHNFISRFDAIKSLPSHCNCEYDGEVTLGGIGNITTNSPHGIYSVSLPLHDGSTATFTGACLDQVTSTFPTYQLSAIEQEIHQKFDGDVRTLPRLPSTVGGEVDFIIGIKYFRYYPEIVFQLPSGLTIFRSKFKNADGSQGVIGGPHQIFNQISKYGHQCQFISNQMKLFKDGFQVNPDISLLGFKNGVTDVSLQSTYHVSKLEQSFKESESAGTDLSYRCIKCRSCKNCVENCTNESLSIQEEVEQDLITKSVKIDTIKHETRASLPLLHNPVTKLNPNRSKALKVYHQQVRKLNQHPDDKNDVLESEKKLQKLGHVEFVRNLSTEQQQALHENPIQNFIPWRAVWKTNSISTPCRIVFDASQPTSSGFSLNNIIAKGRNNMNKLIEIIIRWSCRKFAYHTDVQKMYNTIKLVEDHWCLQRYLWDNELSPDRQPEEKVIKTLIYGVKSSGNQAEYALRQTSLISKDRYPRVHEVITNDFYVDDCISGESSIHIAMETADNLEIVLNKGGFGLKGFTFSGQDPPENLSADGQSISVGGMLWYPKIDKLSLDIQEMNFAKKQRGKKPLSSCTVPSNLTRRQCISKVSEIFDPTGKVTPITAGLKIDLHELVNLKLQWDDSIPDNLRPLWKSHFEMIQEIKNIKFRRTFIPDDAINLDITTLDFGDASTSIACAAIYARILKKNGEYSTQLVFSRSKLVSQPTTQPRAELTAAVLNCHTGEVVRRAFGKLHKKCIKLTDSQIVLHWISNNEKALKQWVRNRVIEIQRFTDIKDWYYINTTNMLADLGTRKGAKLNDVGEDSDWFKGQQWMKLNESSFPVKKVSEIILTSSELKEASNETQFTAFKPSDNVNFNCNVPDDVSLRYSFSNYVVDPNKFRFKTVIRVLALVQRFIKRLKYATKNKQSRIPTTRSKSKSSNQQIINDDDIKEAEDYFFEKATIEVKHFVKRAQYVNISEEINGILYYSGRILQDKKINIITPMSAVMHDLHSTSFCVPLVDKHSPLAYSIINEVHWHDETVKHCGIESILRFVMKKAYIIEGREVAKRVKRNCIKCRYLTKQAINVEMGKLSARNLTIAPAFYFSQIDLAGPFKSYCNHHRRSTMKVWMAIFCCMTTSATSIKIMDDYSTSSFIQAFTRFACQHGYPKKLQIDSGSQLIKGCENMKINFQDLRSKLHINHSVNFNVCPVGAHNFNGKVERKIKEIKRSIERTIVSFKLSVIEWETVSTEIANGLNNMPLAIGDVTSDFESIDLITPNRLMLGRNNERSPIGPVESQQTVQKILQRNKEIFETWFDHWLVSYVPQLVKQPKWFKTDTHVNVGDIVLFVKKDSSLAKNYQIGRIKTIFVSNDTKIRKVEVEYQNHNEDVKRETIRSVRDLVVIHHMDEVDLMEELNSMFNEK